MSNLAVVLKILKLHPWDVTVELAALRDSLIVVILKNKDDNEN